MGDNMGKIIKEQIDLTNLEWTNIRSSSGTNGMLLKAYDISKKGKIYYKVSNFNSIDGFIGHECINEIIVDRLLTILNIEHLEYDLINSKILIDDKEYDTYICSSKDFKRKDERKIPLDVFYKTNKLKEEAIVDFFIRFGWQDKLYSIILVDYLIMNRDRHGANCEILKSKTGQYRVAPLFDHGISLMFSCHTKDELEEFDILKDYAAQTILETKSTKDNLNVVSKEFYCKINKLKKSDKEYILKDLEEITSKEFVDKIWEMIWARWCYCENLFSKR